MSWIKYLTDWWKFRKLSKELDKTIDSHVNMWFNSVPSYDTLLEDREQHYFHGMLNLKNEVKRRAKDGSYEEVLYEAGERLLDFARVETEEQRLLREKLESVLIRKGKDIKTEVDKEQMISKRIDHYKKLIKEKQIREINRKMRKAYKDQDMVTHAALRKELEKLYGKLRTTSL